MELKEYKFGLDKESSWDADKIGRFDAFFPKEDFNGIDVAEEDIPKYIKIVIGGKTHYLKRTLKSSRKSNIYVNPSTYSGDALKSIAIEKSSEIYFLIYKVRNDINQKISTWGLVIALIGLLIDGSFAIGKAGYVKFVLTNREIFVWMVAALILKAVGLALIYFKGLKESK